jgi:NADPH:quinone reductase-like Zn-dependent oxidoreductase
VQSGNIRSATNIASFSSLGPTADGRIKPLVDQVFAFEQLEQAKEMMETNKHVGKIVLRMPV